MGRKNIMQDSRFCFWPGETPDAVPDWLLEGWGADLTPFRRFIQVRHDMERRTEDCLEDWFSLIAGGERFGVVIRYQYGAEYTFEADRYDEDGCLVKMDDYNSFAHAVHALLDYGGDDFLPFARMLEELPDWWRAPEVAFMR